MPTLKIADTLGNAILDRPKVAIGSLCDWVATSSRGALENVRWTVDGAIQNYVVQERTRGPVKCEAYVEKLTTHVGAQARWYWSRAGRVTVKVTASVKGAELERTIVVVVKAGEVVEFSSVTSDVKIAKLNPSNKEVALTFGGGTGAAGILWTAKLIAPPRRGDVSFTQVMTVHRKFTLEGGKSAVISSEGEYVLDEDFHYGVSERGIEPSGDEEHPETVPCLDCECLTLQEADSPSTVLARTVDRPSMVRPLAGDYKSVEIDEHFRTFLMYRPRGGIWVSLADLSWHWGGVAEYQVDTWVLTSKDSSKAPTGKKRVLFPTWSGNRNDLM